MEEALGLVECPSLNCVDISDNFIEDERLLEEVWAKLPKIAVIYMQGNPCIKKMEYAVRGPLVIRANQIEKVRFFEKIFFLKHLAL